MDDIKREDVIYALRRLENYIDCMDEEIFANFKLGRDVCTQYMKPCWDLKCVPKDPYEDIRRNIVRLSVRMG